MTTKWFLPALALPLALMGCENGPTAPAGRARVGVRFGISSPSASSSRSPSFNVSPPRSAAATTDSGLVVAGTNGTLKLTNISFIVSSLELKCDGMDDSAAVACAKFEAPPSFVTLPLGTGAVEVASAAIPAGSYSKLEFEVEDLKADAEDDATQRQQVSDLLNRIRTVQGFGDFPDQASMVVEGTFTPTGGAPTAFRVYLKAEIEVGMRLVPPLTIGSNGASRALTVDVQPSLWFRNADSTVRDLSKLDFKATGSVVEFEIEMGRGFDKVEFGD